MKNKLQTLKKQIESSQKGIDYVDSLEEKRHTDLWKKYEHSNFESTMSEYKNKQKINKFILFIWICIAISTILWACGIIYLIKKTLWVQ